MMLVSLLVTLCNVGVYNYDQNYNKIMLLRTKFMEQLYRQAIADGNVDGYTSFLTYGGTDHH